MRLFMILLDIWMLLLYISLVCLSLPELGSPTTSYLRCVGSTVWSLYGHGVAVFYARHCTGSVMVVSMKTFIGGEEERHISVP